MNLKNAHIVYNPPTEQVYIAIGEGEWEFTSTAQVERTDDFVNVMLAWLGDGREREFYDDEGRVYSVCVAVKVSSR